MYGKAKVGKSNRGFSLIELLIVIAIIATLMGLLLPAIQKVRIAGRKAESANNMKQMALAVHEWHDVYKILPPTVGWDNPYNKPTQNGVNGTVFFMLLPYLEYGNYYQQFYGTLDSACFSNGAVPVQPIGVAAYRANLLTTMPAASFREPKQFNTVLDLSTIPYAKSPSFTSYLANQNLLDARLPLEKVSKGTTNVMLFTEGMKSCVGNVYDVTNHDANYFDGSGGPFQATRTNNWAVGTETYGTEIYYGQSSLMTTNIYYDYSNVDNPSPPSQANVKQVVGVIQAAAPCTALYTAPQAQWSIGNIPAFFREDPYYEPWSSGKVTWTQYVNNNWVGTFTPGSEGLIPLRATYQDGRSPSVNPAVVPPGTAAPAKNCLWFGAQAHLGAIHVAMLDGSVRSVDPAVSPDSWNAAFTPTGGEVVGLDFFE